MTTYDSKSYFNYFNKLVGEYNNSRIRSIGKKTIDVVYSPLSEKNESS